MSYRQPQALAGTTPSPIPSGNTATVQSFTVGSGVPAMGLLGPHVTVPWLDANLVVRNVNREQAALGVIDNVRSALTATSNVVDDIRWVAGGYVYARWRPLSSQPAVQYATMVRDALLQSAQRISPQSQIVMTRFRVNMPMGTNLYVYPTGTVPPPPPMPTGAPPVTSSSGPPPPESEGAAAAAMTTALAVTGVVGVVAIVGGLGFFLYRRRQGEMQQNRRSRRRR